MIQEFSHIGIVRTSDQWINSLRNSNSPQHPTNLNNNRIKKLRTFVQLPKVAQNCQLLRASGKKLGKITDAQQTVDEIRDIFSLIPLTQPIGEPATGFEQQEIEAGKQRAIQYGLLAIWLEFRGIVVFVMGLGLLFSI